MLAVLLACLIFLPPFNGYVSQGIETARDHFDKRPEQTALFIGNSRTFYNDMPHMVRAIADSAGYSKKLRIEMDAEPGVSLGDHIKSEETQALLSQRWDHVVLQVLSSDQYSAQQSGPAWDDAENLIREVQAKGSLPVMFVTWRYTHQCTGNAGMPKSGGDLSPSGYADMHINIQRQHARLAALTGVVLVNVGMIWEALQSQPKDFSLYYDCNHPSIYGSYLSALMFYSYFSGNDVLNVTFRPEGMSAQDAQMLRKVVSDYLAEGAKA
ncbi:hypothetical protein ASE04_07540 [Rhizobium sp. Root708]|uniref:DUF4886 domain-containing protein n=1 Tax=Rhizobium sp. Root708 TaxID=1736592 RepID=UPI0006F51C5E|nr:DUF4886 domain-containing protein [Rhizobium sp. Root708]KRB53064.1 hypothetical protein ASE04_07540 [Rhizobium sp. Root708]